MVDKKWLTAKKYYNGQLTIKLTRKKKRLVHTLSYYKELMGKLTTNNIIIINNINC